MKVDTNTQDRYIAKMRADGEYPDPEPDELSEDEKHKRFMALLASQGEGVAIATYGDPRYWDQCRHGQWHCRYGGRKHAASTCVHKDAPQHECTTPTKQLGLFGVTT